MRKKLCLLSVVLCGLVLLTGCENPINNLFGGKEDSNYIRYGFHQYDDEAHHTEEMDIYYDKDGNFKKIEIYYVWDSSEQKSCKGFTNSEDEKYPGVIESCTEIENGKVKRYTSVTDKSIEAGVFDDSSYSASYLKDYYELCKTENDAKEFFKQGLEQMKNSITHSNDQNYIIMANERVEW